MRVVIAGGLALLLAFGLIIHDAAAADGTLARIPKSAGGVRVATTAGEPVCGEDLADAVEVPGLPYLVVSGTCDNLNDYDVDCPYTGAGSPDVVYAWTADFDGWLRIDLCGSDFDTKLIVMDAALEVLACNDDAYYDPACGYNTSLIPALPVSVGVTYYIVVDGYGGDCGEFTLDISPAGAPVPCALPAVGEAENEPALADGYVDEHNGGCNSADAGYPLQELPGDNGGNYLLHGTSGWYDAAARDTDWFIAVFGAEGVIEWTLDGEQRIQGRVLGGLDCINTISVDEFVAGPCSPATITVTGEPGDLVWFWIAPLDFVPPAGFDGHEFRYNASFTGLQAASVATDEMSWGAVKSLYR